MEAEIDNFLKVLQKRQRNLTKKLERIKKKQADLRSTGKEMKEEERKMIESGPQVEELLQETEKLIQQYQSHLETIQKEQKKPQPKPEENRTAEVLHLWVLGEFLSNPVVKERFVRENPNEQDLEPFLLLHAQAKGQTGDKFPDILSTVEKSVELYLAKSEKIAPGTMRTYRKLSEFTTRGLAWSLNQIRPQTPVKTELKLESGHVYSTQTVVEKKKEVEETKVEPKVEVKQEVKTENLPPSKWAEDEEDEWAEKAEEVVEENKASAGQEDEGFIEVTKRAKKVQGKEGGEDERGRGRGRGRGFRNGGRGRRYREPRNK